MNVNQFVAIAGCLFFGWFASIHGRSTDCAIFIAASLIIYAMQKNDKPE